MTDTRKPIEESDLHAYVDGRLDETRRAEVEAWLANRPEDAARVADWQAQNAGIRALFSAGGEAKPDDARLFAARAVRPARVPRTRLLQAAAAVALFVSGAAAGQLAPSLLRPDDGGNGIETVAVDLPQQSRSAFLIYASEVRHPVEVGADEQAHLATWLGKRLDLPFRIPDLTATGLELVGGRLVPVSGKPGALLMYEDAAGQRITVMVGRNDENRSTSFRYESDGGVETFYWIDGPVGYAVSGEVPRERLQQIADECYRQFPDEDRSDS
ncbi:anti-sigma factor [Pseudomonas sp. R2.Fl]|nr:anti-sigma factor [Pseudomonas sp. R2.Fl]